MSREARPFGSSAPATLQAVTDEPMLSRNPDVVFRSMEGGGVLLNIKTGAYHEVNSTAREIWAALETPTTESQVIEGMREQFGDVGGLDADVGEFIGELAERSLVVVSDIENSN